MRKRNNQIKGPFVPRTLEMLCSPAFGALSLAGHRILARIEIEHAQHGGRDNGRLPVTFANFDSFGLHRMAIAPGIREACALGFIEVTRRGRSGNGEHRTSNLFRLTYLPTGRAATDEWLANTHSALHHYPMQIREAQIEDAVEACEILRRSIVELCRADHQDDPGVLEKWLNNKTPDNVRSWIAHPDSYVFVVTHDTILGVAAVTSCGEITLNYVSPDARFQGVSKALLNQLEAKALELGNGVCTLTSTETARRFYLSAGYAEQSSPSAGGTGSSFRMERQLSPPAQAG